MHGCWLIDISMLPLMNDYPANPNVWIFLFPSPSLMLGLLLYNNYCVCFFTLTGALLLDPKKKVVELLSSLQLHGKTTRTVVLCCYLEPDLSNRLPILTTFWFTAITFGVSGLLLVLFSCLSVIWTFFLGTQFLQRCRAMEEDRSEW